MRFVKMLSLIMADQLRSAVLGSIEQYTEFFKQYDFKPWEEAARAAYPDDITPENWEVSAAADHTGQRAALDGNVYWRM